MTNTVYSLLLVSSLVQAAPLNSNNAIKTEFSQYNIYTGWSKNATEVTLDCTRTDVYNKYNNLPPTLRILKANYPEDVKILTLKNCHELRIAFVWESTSLVENLSTINIINVTKLRMLDMSYKGPWIPRNLHLEDVRDLSLRTGKLTTTRPSSSGQNVTFKNVVINNLQENGLVLKNIRRGRIEWINVTVNCWERNAVSITGSGAETVLIIKNSTFKEMPEEAMTFTGKEVSIENCKISELSNKSLSLKVETAFSFKGNKIGRIKRNGITVDSPKVSISENHVRHLDSQGLNITLRSVDLLHNYFGRMASESAIEIQGPDVGPTDSPPLTPKFSLRNNLVENSTSVSLVLR